MPNLLFVNRLYSGLQKTLMSGDWSPKGIPTIYKFIEKIDKENADLHVIFTARNPSRIKYGRVKFKNLKSKIIVLPFISIFKKSKKFNLLFTRIYHGIYIIGYVLLNNFNLIYSDRVNIEAISFCANYLRKNVILRLLGVYPDMRYLDLVC